MWDTGPRISLVFIKTLPIFRRRLMNHAICHSLYPLTLKIIPENQNIFVFVTFHIHFSDWNRKSACLEALSELATETLVGCSPERLSLFVIRTLCQGIPREGGFSDSGPIPRIRAPETRANWFHASKPSQGSHAWQAVRNCQKQKRQTDPNEADHEEFHFSHAERSSST